MRRLSTAITAAMSAYDAELEAFFNFCAASTEADRLSPRWSPLDYFADTDGEDDNPLSISDVQSLSNYGDSTFQITHSNEGTPVSDWSSLSLEFSDSKSDISSLSINPSFLVTRRHSSQERGLREEHAIDTQSANIAPPPQFPEPLALQSLQPEPAPVKCTSSEGSVLTPSSDPSDGTAGLVETRHRKRERVEPVPAKTASRPRTRYYVREIRQSSKATDSEYFDSDQGNDTDGISASSIKASPRNRRTAGRFSKPARRILCEEPFCECTFTRPADLRRHIATLHKNLSRTEALEETRPEHRLWCKHCGIILGRVDARQRHESHGSCARSQVIMKSRIKNGTVRGRVSRGQLIK